jgi:response regulator of citrate/malate metabolism
LKEAGNVVKRYKPDLILLDVHLLGDVFAKQRVQGLGSCQSSFQ